MSVRDVPKLPMVRDLPPYLADLAVDGRAAPGQARRLIFEAIKRAADRGEPCPTCEMFREICGFEAVSATVYHVRRLEMLKLIRVRRFNRSREVVITATGKRTAASRETLPQWRERRALR